MDAPSPNGEASGHIHGSGNGGYFANIHLRKFVGNRMRDRPDSDHAAGCDARIPVVEPAPEADRRRREVDVRMWKNDRRIVTGQLHDGGRSGGRERRENLAARVGGAREEYSVHSIADGGFRLLGDSSVIANMPCGKCALSRHSTNFRNTAVAPAPGLRITALPAASACRV